MFALIFSTLTLSLCAVGLKANTSLIQSPGALVVREGETVEIRCVLNSTNVNDIVNKFIVHWYNSRNGEIKLSLYVNGQTYRSPGFSDRFQLSRDDASNSYSLTIREVVIDDSADYICGIWGHLFGNGTQLNVTIANPPILTQFPRLERVTEGHTAQLWCSMENAEVGKTDVHWYRGVPGQDMDWVLTHEAGGSVRRRPGFTERFQPFREASNSSFTLTVTNVTLNDSAVYYCTVWGDIRGNGTQLNVTISQTKENQFVVMYLAWIILPLVLGVLAVTGAICLIKRRASGSHQSSQSGAADDHTPGVDYENISVARNVPNTGDHQADPNATYMDLQRPTQSIYGRLRGEKR